MEKEQENERKRIGAERGRKRKRESIFQKVYSEVKCSKLLETFGTKE